MIYYANMPGSGSLGGGIYDFDRSGDWTGKVISFFWREIFDGAQTWN